MSHLRIVCGHPTDVEVAALVAALASMRCRDAEAAAAAGRATSPSPVNGWADPAARLRRPLPHGPHAWAHSAWPR